MSLRDSAQTGIIPLAKGSDYADSVTLTQTLGGSPLNLTGYTVESYLVDFAGALMGTFVCAITDAINGTISRTLAKEVTALLRGSDTPQYTWVIKLVTPSLKVLPEIQGGATVEDKGAPS